VRSRGLKLVEDRLLGRGGALFVSDQILTIDGL
jgi:hypothetical protein